MKTNQNAIITTMFLLIASNVFSQSWEKTKPDILYATDKYGSVSTVKVGVELENNFDYFEIFS